MPRVEIYTDGACKRNPDGPGGWGVVLSSGRHRKERRGWTTASKQPVKNSDLWRALDDAARRHRVHWRWVKGHNGDPGNERADALADLGAAEHA